MNSEISAADQIHLRRCLELAARAEGRTSPNPMVGAVIADRTGTVIAEGWHERAGEPHAERIALSNLTGDATGGTIYVSLEPCCHHGRTPPCTEAVLASGVRRVVVGCTDPNPVVAGKGLRILREAGLQVDLCSGALNEECMWLNRAFIKRVITGLPWVCLKMAMTLDGKIADRNFQSRWISGPRSRKKVHELRNLYDSVLVGTGTLLRDDPELTVRDLDSASASVRNPIRLTVDRRLQLEPTSRFCSTRDAGRAVVYAEEKYIDAKKIGAYPASLKIRGVEDIEELTSLLKLVVSEERINSVLCEGGGTLAASLLDQNLVDEIYWVIAPKILADNLAQPIVNSKKERRLDQSIQLHARSLFECGEDIWIHGLLHPRATLFTSWGYDGGSV